MSEFQDGLVALRRELHALPELGLDLPRTQAAVLAALDGLPLEVSTGAGLTSVTAVLRGGRPGPAVLLRGDMDALPVTESTGLPFAGPEGAMHACGHDLHTAMLVGAARLLVERREELAGDVIFMFQPGEEGFSGARHMIEEGVLEAAGSAPVAAYALHVVSNILPSGIFVSRGGPAMAAADRLLVTVRGRGGHGSSPHAALDPIPAACEMVLALQTFVTRRFDVFDPVVLTVGRIAGGTADNVIPGSVEFAATIRTFSKESQALMEEGTVRLLRGIADGHGLDLDLEYRTDYPVTVNDHGEAAFAARALTEVFGDGRYVDSPRPFPASEDFSFVLDRVPGAFILLGACPPDADPATAPMNHSPDAVFDEAVMTDGATALAELALRRLR
ncbi:M20 family metallopeptidase [Actinocorallia longicatena]|uniref:M20 family metallopeptidase n=1 Tax=Actinocorallia longicatena TaxID=111803 RepID=A0ABP6QAQ8_9ACTN